MGAKSAADRSSICPGLLAELLEVMEALAQPQL